MQIVQSQMTKNGPLTNGEHDKDRQPIFVEVPILGFHCDHCMLELAKTKLD